MTDPFTIFIKESVNALSQYLLTEYVVWNKGFLPKSTSKSELKIELQRNQFFNYVSNVLNRVAKVQQQIDTHI